MSSSTKEGIVLAGVYLPLFLRAFDEVKIATLLLLGIQPPTGMKRLCL